MDIKEKLNILPAAPGIYLMKDSMNNIIYVGKSKNLKSRVSSYFYKLKSHSPKVSKLVKNTKSFDYILTDTEFEAFLLECRFIQDIKPAYNRLMKTPLAYSYIRINKNYYNIQICSENTNTSEYFYFGPFTSSNTVERALEGIKLIFKIQCSSNFKNSSPCLNYSLGKCIGICFNPSARAEYTNILKNITAFLSGKNNSILEKMELKMKEAAEKLNFDTAAEYRDYISEVKSLLIKEKVLKFAKSSNNLAVTEYLDEHTVKFFLISGTDIIFTEKYCLSEPNTFEHVSALNNIIIDLLKNKGFKTSREIDRQEIDKHQIIYSYLNNKKNFCNYIVIPKAWIYNDNKTLLETALHNLFKF